MSYTAPAEAFHSEGIPLQITDSAITIVLPQPSSMQHLFRVVGALWEFRDFARDDADSDSEIVIDVSAFKGDLPLPIVGIVSAMARELDTVGRRLRVTGSLAELDNDVPVYAGPWNAQEHDAKLG